MMMNQKDAQIGKMMDVLEKLNLSENQLSAAEDFLSGRAGKEILERLPFQDLSGVPSGETIKIFRDLEKKGKREYIVKFFQVLFAIGKATCYLLIPVNILVEDKGGSGYEYAPEEKAAVYAMWIGAASYALGGYTINTLISDAEKNPENLKKAMKYQGDGSANGRIVLLAAYFILKYGEERRVEEEDAALLQEYENIMISNLELIYNNQIDKGAAQEIKDAIYKNQMTERILRLAAKKTDISDFMIKLLGGMSYLNFPLSIKLKNVVRVCFAADMEKTLDAIRTVSKGLSMDIGLKGGAYDRIFGIDSEQYLRWAAKMGYQEVLKEQLNNNRECYLKVMNQVDMEFSNQMLEIVGEQDHALYEKLLAEERLHGKSRKMEEMIRLVVDNTPNVHVVRAYLRGEAGIDSLYPYIDEIKNKWGNGSPKTRELLKEYEKTYQDEAFARRCRVYVLLKGKGYFFLENIRDRERLKEERLKELLEDMEKEGLAMPYRLLGMSILYDGMDFYYNQDLRQHFLDYISEYFMGYLETGKEEMVKAFQSSEAFGRFFGLHVMRRDTEKNKNEILSFAPDSAKMVREELLDILYGQSGWEEEVKTLLVSRKAAERELAVRVLLRWQGEGNTYQDLLARALEKEKNSKVKALLESTLAIGKGGISGEKTVAKTDLVKELHKGGTRRSLAWAYQTPFSAVHKVTGEEAQEEYLQAVLLCYSSSFRCGISEKAALLAEGLRPEELAVYVNELFDKWMEAGAEAKKRWVLYAASIHGGEEIIPKLQHWIQEWPQHSRGAIAAEAVQALSLNPSPQALLIVDGMSRKFKFKQIKAAAGKALEFAAAQLGISREELADRIVPDFGFDKNMERVFDYGERHFTVTITPGLEIEVYDGTGKKLKNMPAPGKRDEEEKAAASYEAFKQMKKQMKMTVNSQRMRLEQALSTGREWKTEAWKKLFVKNPVMHQFAIGLIWGIYENKKLLQSFRYMEDGSFNTADEEEYELPENGQIGLVHPIELAEEEREAWRQQLEDYEIRQPIEQIDRTFYPITEEEAGMKAMERFGGCIVNDLSLGGKLLNLGWYRGSVEDGGGFYTYYREDMELGIGVELHFSGSFVGGENEDVTVYDASFYRAGEVKRGSYVYDKAGEDKAYFLKDVPARYFSEIVLQLAKATASSQERNENWRTER